MKKSKSQCSVSDAKVISVILLANEVLVSVIFYCYCKNNTRSHKCHSMTYGDRKISLFATSNNVQTQNTDIFVPRFIVNNKI